jgi:hemoglobin-like flavoprotein
MQQAPQQTMQNMGLEALYQSMASQFAPISQQFNPMDQFYQPQQQQQMPTYRSQASSYRPNMSGIPANLSRVAPRVTDQQMHPERYIVDDGGGDPNGAPTSGQGGD